MTFKEGDIVVTIREMDNSECPAFSTIDEWKTHARGNIPQQLRSGAVGNVRRIEGAAIFVDFTEVGVKARRCLAADLRPVN